MRLNYITNAFDHPVYFSGLGVVRPRRADRFTNLADFSQRHSRSLSGLSGSITPAAANSIAQAIQNQEGYYPGSVAYVNNNPGNLKYVGQPGATAGAGGFAQFSSYNAGYSALLNQINLDATRGTDVNGNPTTTVSQLIGSWAPASENNTPAYVASVTAYTGYDPNAALSSLGTGSDMATVPVDTSTAGLPDYSTAGVLDESYASVVSASGGVSVGVAIAVALGVLLFVKLQQ